MAKLKLELPTLQNWSCHNCAGCCRQHGIFITDAEKQRIEGQDWSSTGLVSSDDSLFERSRNWHGKTQWRLAQTEDGSCIFLDEKGLCRIHGKFGEAAKPLACRIYPYAFHPAGGKLAVSLRFSCPSVVSNLGTSLTKQRDEIQSLARAIAPSSAADLPPPKVHSQEELPWPDFKQLLDRFDATIADEEAPLLTRLLRSLSWIGIIEQAKFAAIRGPRLTELLDLIVQATAEDVEEALTQPPEVTRIAHTQFRLMAGQYGRQDTFGTADTSLRGRWKLLRAAWQLTQGRGETPRLQEALPPVPFEALEGSFPVPEEADEIFTRYFRVKIQGVHFCGPGHYDVAFVEGAWSLILMYPVVLWLARWLATAAGRTAIETDDVARALAIADHHHGFSPAFGTWGSRQRVITLARAGQIGQLCRWYSR